MNQDPSNLKDLDEKRRAIRPLLSPTDPADALASYYALWHDPRRTQITLHRDAQQRVTGFVTVSQTGVDLFRPLVTLRARDKRAVPDLLRAALSPNRSYQVTVPVALAPSLRDQMDFAQSSLNRIYILAPSRFQPIINVLVQHVAGADGTPRFQIESQNQLMAISGTNWRSPTHAEVFVWVDARDQGRGWGKSVVSACTAALLEERLRPLYLVEEGNQASIRIAERVGYVDTDARELSGESRLRQ